MQWAKSQLAFIINKILSDIKLTPDEKILLNSLVPTYTIYHKDYIVNKIKENIFNTKRITFYKFDTSEFIKETPLILSRIVGKKFLVKYKDRYMTIVKDISLIATNYQHTNSEFGLTPIKHLLKQPYIVIKSVLFSIYADETIPIEVLNNLDDLDSITEFKSVKENYNEFIIREGDNFLIAIYDKEPKFYTLLDTCVKEISINDVLNLL